MILMITILPEYQYLSSFFLVPKPLGKKSPLRYEEKNIRVADVEKGIIMKRGAAARASCHPPPLPRILSEKIMRSYKGYIHTLCAAEIRTVLKRIQ